MKKIVMSFLLIGALALAGSAQTTHKTTKSTPPVAKSKVVAKTNSSSSVAQAKKSNTATATQKTSMVKPKHKHHLLHKAKQKTTK